MCVCVFALCVYACVCLHKCTQVCQWLTSNDFLKYSPPYLRESLLGPGVPCWPVSFRDVPDSASSVLGLPPCTAVPDFS